MAYRSAKGLVKWLTILLVANAMTCLLAVGLDWSEIRDLERSAELGAEANEREAELIEDFPENEAEYEEWLEGRGQPTESWVDAHIAPSEVLFALCGFLLAGVGIALIVLFCLWIPRANRNARALGAIGMRFTPRWCVIWYLIPIMNLFKPYQAMKEIWKASVPSDASPWQQRAVSPLLGWWWILWLVSALAAGASLRFSWRAGSLDEFVTASWITLVSDAMDIPLSIVAMLLVRQIHAMQERSRYTTAFE